MVLFVLRLAIFHLQWARKEANRSSVKRELDKGFRAVCLRCARQCTNMKQRASGLHTTNLISCYVTVHPTVDSILDM